MIDTPSALSRPERQRLIAATRAQIAESGGLEAAASLSRVGAPRLSRYQRPEYPDMMPVDVLAELALTSGRAPLLYALASVLGHVAVPLPTDRTRPLARDMATMAERMARLFADYQDALANDGRVDRAEAQRLHDDFTTLVRVAVEAQASLAPLVRGDDD